MKAVPPAQIAQEELVILSIAWILAALVTEIITAI